MKKLLFKIYFLICIMFSFCAESFVLSKVDVNCTYANSCTDYKGRFDSLINVELSEDSLKNKIKYLILDNSISKFKYEVILEKGQYLLTVKIQKKDIVGEITFNSNSSYNVDFNNIAKFIPIQKNSFLSEESKEKSIEMIKSFLEDRGHGDNVVIVGFGRNGNTVDLIFEIFVGKSIIVKDILVNGNKIDSQLRILNQIKKFKNKIWDKVKLKVLIDSLNTQLFELGHFFSNINVRVLESDSEGVVLDISYKLGSRYNFSFKGNRMFSHQEIIEHLKLKLKGSSNSLNENFLKNTLIDLYKNKGVFNTEIDFALYKGKLSNGTIYQNYFIDIEEGKKISIEKISFSGNFAEKSLVLEEFFYKNAPVLISRGFLDVNYIKKFPDLLKRYYLSKGYVLVDISDPLVIYKENAALVEFKIKEKQQATISQINILNTPEEYKDKIKNVFSNKVGKKLDVLNLENDIKNGIGVLQDNGFYYALLKTVRNNEIVEYNSDFTEAVINVEFKNVKKVILSELVITGYRKTRRKVIEREFTIRPGDFITLKVIDEIRTKLSGLGLFSLVKVSPVIQEIKHDQTLVNLIIRVKEKDFGVGEFAPGYRTDIGAKTSVSLSYNNLSGMNRTISGKVQANQRFNFNNLDSRRRNEEKRLVEYSINGTYLEPWIFPNWITAPIQFNTTTSFKRKRFFGFDANIFRLSPKLSKQVSDNWSVSLKYQYERIDQFDATEAKDNTNFEIGGLTPSLSLDLRDSPINSKSGAFFGLSFEYASPFLGSTNDRTQEVDFYKFVSRNKFYYTLDKVTFALSTSFGVQANLASNEPVIVSNEEISRGFIPSIKVFRLDGANNVRGFSESEINRLRTGEDISAVVISDKAYFSNIKFEPRYPLTDGLVLGIFIDAGNVYNKSYKALALRSSFGGSLKVVTPVGSLDFDYGIKTHRNHIGEGQKETFGKFHLSIGSF